MKASDILIQTLCDDAGYCCESIDLGARSVINNAIEAVKRLEEAIKTHCVACGFCNDKMTKKACPFNNYIRQGVV